MSYLTAFFITCGVITVVTPALLWQIHRAWRAEQAKNCDPYDVGPDTAPPVRETEPGVNLADLDECELIYSLPPYSASRDHLKKRIAADPWCAATFERIANNHEHPGWADFADRLLKEARDEQGDTDHTTTEGD